MGDGRWMKEAEAEVPWDWEVLRAAGRPCSSAGGTARSADAPSSPPMRRSAPRSDAGSPTRTPPTAAAQPCASAYCPATNQNDTKMTPKNDTKMTQK